MNDRTYELDEETLIVKTGDFEVRIPLFEVFREMTDEDLGHVAEIITADQILDEAVKRLLDTSESLSRNTDHANRLTLEVLARMEHRLLSGNQWQWLRDLLERAKREATHTHLYWRLYHHNEDTRKLLERLGVDSPGYCELADFKAFTEMVEGKLDAAFAILPDIDITFAIAEEAGRMRYVYRLVRDIITKAEKVNDGLNGTDYSFARWVIDEVARRVAEAPATTADDIIAQVASGHGLSVNDVIGRSTQRHIVTARHEAMWRIRNETTLSFPSIGKLFGRDHSTVQHAVKLVEKRRAATTPTEAS